jgi:hypothetical protein
VSGVPGLTEGFCLDFDTGAHIPQVPPAEQYLQALQFEQALQGV